ncbi:hypothetical protein BX661DRAFT_59278 [Kickxella alabastrina]|uniref:uncharacterized protein n=1 Tax=Kickxella alabastrina TaxID=61397 RepID=UPI00221FE0E2|nr:uncharacterized protein BX661DRAFT_59278 [Kickxella alabastrina]KAI7822456.1 hypothetical protein BX661DRAFT_59278 [Kickxella alabastrina]
MHNTTNTAPGPCKRSSIRKLFRAKSSSHGFLGFKANDTLDIGAATAPSKHIPTLGLQTEQGRSVSLRSTRSILGGLSSSVKRLSRRTSSIFAKSRCESMPLSAHTWENELKERHHDEFVHPTLCEMEYGPNMVENKENSEQKYALQTILSVPVLHSHNYNCLPVPDILLPSIPQELPALISNESIGVELFGFEYDLLADNPSDPYLSAQCIDTRAAEDMADEGALDRVDRESENLRVLNIKHYISELIAQLGSANIAEQAVDMIPKIEHYVGEPVTPCDGQIGNADILQDILPIHCKIQLQSPTPLPDNPGTISSLGIIYSLGSAEPDTDCLRKISAQTLVNVDIDGVKSKSEFKHKNTSLLLAEIVEPKYAMWASVNSEDESQASRSRATTISVEQVQTSVSNISKLIASLHIPPIIVSRPLLGPSRRIIMFTNM